MKYFKFAQISEETGISWAIEQPLSGPSNPDLPGLTNIIQLDTNRVYYLGQVDDSAQEDPNNHIWELTTAEYAQELKDHVQHNINQRLDSIYLEEIDFRNALFNKYHETASVAGIYKYEQAKELIADNTATATEIRAEATARGIDPVTLANRIVTNHEDFRAKEAKVAGIRGMMYDRLTNFTFDLDNPDTSYQDFISEEKIGTRTENELNPETGELEDVEVDIMVNKYTLNISARFEKE